MAEPQELRREVAAFAQAMERELRENDHKRHWSEMPMDYLMRRLRQEYEELRGAYAMFAASDTPETRAEVLSEAADVANFAMFVADYCSALPKV